MAAAESVDFGDVLLDVFRELRDVGPDYLAAFWPLLLIFAAVGLGKLTWAIYQQRRLARSGIRDIDAMDGPTFERYLGTVFRRLGYDVDLVGNSGGDYGCDLLVQKNGKRIAVQAKCWKQTVGVKAVQEAAAAKAMYDAASAMVVTNSRFSQQAAKLARANGVQLWGRDELVKTLLTARKVPEPMARVDSPEPAAVAAATPQAAVKVEPICARCGESVSEKVRAYCEAHRERFGGLIYCYRHQRSFRRRDALR